MSSSYFKNDGRGYKCKIRATSMNDTGMLILFDCNVVSSWEISLYLL